MENLKTLHFCGTALLAWPHSCMHACSVIYYHACNTVFTWTADMQRFLGAVALRFQSHSVLTPEVMHSVWQETPSCLTGLLLFNFIGIKFNLNKMRHCCPQVVWKSSAQDLWTRANRLPGEIFCWWHFDEIQGQCFFFLRCVRYGDTNKIRTGFIILGFK